MEIKRLGIEEIGLVVGLFDKYRQFYKQPPDIGLAERFIQERLANNESVIFVATDGTVPAGFTQLYPQCSSVCAVRNWILNDLYVDNAYRKTGVGRALIDQAMAFAKSQAATFVQLETAVDNYSAQRLYEAIGFEKQEADAEFLLYKIAV
ncbi:MAG: GNAT family N-acetyltransferase [Bacteroidetes bacterium]|nr:GNAT family N-acetyltransferase [Bacteroidota bacterium]